MKPGHSHPETFKRFKHTTVTIKNKDELCRARAIVTAKAKVDNHPKWEIFKKGKAIQRTEALNLHWEVNVPPQACGYAEIIKFSMAPSLYGYQILVIDETRGYRVDAFGPPQEKQLVLLYNGHHYDAVTSLPGYFASNYFCGCCLKPYDHEGQHACSNNPDHCPACLQNFCSDYREAKGQRRSASLPCDRCKRKFFGETCVLQHRSKSYKGTVADAKNVSVCTQRRKCRECNKLLVGLNKQKSHLCGFVECRCCKEYLEAATHKCFIQVAKSPEQEKEAKRKKENKKKVKRGASTGLATLEANGAGIGTEEDEDNPPPPPTRVF